MNIGNELLIDIKHLCGNRWSVKREDLDTYSRQIRRAAGDISKLRQSGKGLMEVLSFFHTFLICWKKMC